MASGSGPQPPPVRSGLSAETRRWQEAAAELAPAKAFPRMVDNGRFVIGTVSTVGVLLTGFGLVAADRLSETAGPRRLAAAAVVLSVAAILLALVPLILRTRRINLDNLAEVREFHAKEMGKARFISAAGWTLAAALAAAGGAGTWAAIDVEAAAPGVPQAALTATVGKDGRSVHATASVRGLDPGAAVAFEVKAFAGDGSETVVLSGRALADADGTVALDETVVDAAPRTAYRLVVTPQGRAETAVDVAVGA